MKTVFLRVPDQKINKQAVVLSPKHRAEQLYLHGRDNLNSCPGVISSLYNKDRAVVGHFLINIL